MAQTVKYPPAMQETQVRSLGQEEPQAKGMATHSSILVWGIPWTEEPGRLHNPWGPKESDTTEQTSGRYQAATGTPWCNSSPVL